VAVDITWSESQGGAAITPPLSWGNVGNGNSAEDELFIRHDGVEKITDCAYYIQAYTGSYTGSFDAATDYAELLAWGAGNTEGFLINQDLLGGWAAGYTSHKTGRGTSTVPITLDSDSIIGEASLDDGEIEGSNGPGGAEEAHIKVKIAVPAAEGDAGTRQFDQCLKYTYTS
jgi:hypothetical protein